jgi:hypothetical protein
MERRAVAAALDRCNAPHIARIIIGQQQALGKVVGRSLRSRSF